MWYHLLSSTLSFHTVLFSAMAIEMLSLWKVLCEHQFHVIAASLPPEQQNALQAASFRFVNYL